MSVDHLFIDLQFPKANEDRPFAIALLRTDDRGKPLQGAANSGDLIAVLAAVDMMTKAFSAPYIVIACGADLKRAALRDACAKEKTPDPFHGRAWLDFGQVAWPLALAELVPNRALETVGAHFNVPRAHEGTLRGDCAYLSTVYWAMARTYRTALGAEHAIMQTAEKYTGEALRMFRGIVGR